MPGLCSLLKKRRGVFLQDRMSEREKKNEWFGCDTVPVLSDLWVMRGWPWTPQEEAFQTTGKGSAFWEVMGLQTKAGWLQMRWEAWGWEVQLSSQPPCLLSDSAGQWAPKDGISERVHPRERLQWQQLDHIPLGTGEWREDWRREDVEVLRATRAKNQQDLGSSINTNSLVLPISWGLGNI